MKQSPEFVCDAGENASAANVGTSDEKETCNGEGVGCLGRNLRFAWRQCFGNDGDIGGSGRLLGSSFQGGLRHF